MRKEITQMGDLGGTYAQNAFLLESAAGNQASWRNRCLQS